MIVALPVSKWALEVLNTCSVSHRLQNMQHVQSVHEEVSPSSAQLMQEPHQSHNPQKNPAARAVRELLTATQVQNILHVDRSTVYRMAESGRLPAIRVGKQWRFPADEILALVSEPRGSAAGSEAARARTTDRKDDAFTGGVGAIDSNALAGSAADPRSVTRVEAASAVIEVAADLLGVMMVVTDMEGQPITAIANPCSWFISHGDEPEVMAACTAEWQGLADDHNFEPTFHLGPAGFECARAFLRSGRELVGMVLAGGVCPVGEVNAELHNLSPDQREQVLTALPTIANAVSRHAPTSVGAQMEEFQ